MGREPRDSQRKKVYAAEAEAKIKGEVYTTIAECRKYIEFVVNTKWFQKHYEDYVPDHILIGDGRGRRSAARYHSPRNVLDVTFPRGQRDQYTILHEIAHHITPMEYRAHGRTFCKNVLALTRRFIGDSEAIHLRKCFKKYRVKWRVVKK